MSNFIEMLKKILVALLAFLYITSSCEATVYLHYCMGRQVGFSLIPQKSKDCQRCGMKKTMKGMGCCKDEQKIVKSDKSQKVTDLPVTKDQGKKFIAIPPAYTSYHFSIPVAFGERYTPAHGPPGAKPLPLYLLNCLFRI